MGKNIVAFAETREGKFRSVAYEAVRAAKTYADALGGQAVACVVGAGLSDDAAVLGSYGADKIVSLTGDGLSSYSLEGYSAALVEAAKENEAAYLFLSASAMGRELAPSVAVKLGAGLLSDVVEIKAEGDALQASRPIFAGKVNAWVKALGDPVVLTLRPKLFACGDPGEGAAAVEEKAPAVDRDKIRAVLKELLRTEGGKIDLTEADVIVSGGRGMKGPENFKMLEDLAEVLGGTVGASRSAVDAGWREHADQVGQTGKTVSPTIYFAFGISGAIQHLAGMGSSKVIVAVNKDPEAPICKVADYCIVGDLFEVAPVMMEEMKKLKD
jgi:electron transfer flavoprotein alpha subunit